MTPSFSHRLLKRAMTFGALGLAQTAVFAQSTPWTTSWTISYIPVPPVSVPTLSEWGLLGLALLMVIGTAWAIYKKASPGVTAMLAMLTVPTLGALGDHDVMGSAKAVALPALSLPGGGTTDPFSYEEYVVSSSGQQITNTSGVPQRITAVTLTVDKTSAAPSTPANSPQCVVGLVVSPGQSCYVTYVFPAPPPPPPPPPAPPAPPV